MHHRVVLNSSSRAARHWLGAVGLSLGVSLACGPAAGAVAAPGASDAVVGKSRVFVLTDIGADPDDQMSAVRLMLYANEIDVEGLVATTSVWQRERVQPALIREVIRAYRQALPNLRAHAAGWPDEAGLLQRVSEGPARYGMAGVGAGNDSEGSRRLIAAVDRPDSRPVWVAVWGGANVLAQALWRVSHTRSKAEVERFVNKLRVYAISDQDDSGAWIRATFPRLWRVGSLHAFNAYPMAAWLGIHLPAPTDASDMTQEPWLDAHIRRGPLGKVYPRIAFGMEGDTPSFLNLIPNGLSNPDRPDWGGWGGRYGRVDARYGQWADLTDSVMGNDGKLVMSNQATIWRWRAAYQRDFAARIAWTLSPDAHAGNHAPKVTINGVSGTRAIEISACPGDIVRLSAQGTHDPDGQPLRYRWWQYHEVEGGFVPDLVTLQTPQEVDTAVSIPTTKPPGAAEGPVRRFHVMLEVTDTAELPLTAYRRVVITVPHPAGACGAPSR